MGSECNPSKPRYDITMSKRTRKPSSLGKEAGWCPLKSCFSDKESPQRGTNEEEGKSPTRVDEKGESADEKGRPLTCVDEKKKTPETDEGRENDHKSLKQLIDGKRSSLGQHFTEEEKQLQVVVKQHAEGIHGVKFKRMVSRYASVLSRLIKTKRDSDLGSRRKPTLRLSM
ncbi:hypothetical protein RJ640_002012 [Escallonia rubra]|uniref:Uncharacterized protein n=1 Tax=Escallonia rubra TaxID=112253 RepID=A0AA88RRX4_9ASTE|nr:hypothetical protein RJ640_002012 [Escallonia rubra]